MKSNQIVKNQKEDLRTKRTLFLLNNAIISLLSEKSFDAISVLDICNRAMVHRATFYKYYNDKFHLVSTMINELMFNFIDKPQKEKTFANFKDFFINVIADALDYINENKKILKNVILKNKDTAVYFMIIQKAEVATRKLLNKYNSLINDSLPDNVLSQFITAGFTSLLFWWLENDIKYSKEQMFIFFEAIINKI